MMRLGPVAVRLALTALLSGVVPTLASAQESVPPAPPAPTPGPAAPAAQNPVPEAQASQSPKTDPLPVDLANIEEHAKRKQAAVRLDDEQLRFYMLVLAKAPKFKLEDWVVNYDLMNGPTKGGAAMTHAEFLNMVTPKELKELFGATSSSSFAMFQAAVMNAVGQSLISKAVRDMRRADTDRDIQTIRERIDTELSSLLGKGR